MFLLLLIILTNTASDILMKQFGHANGNKTGSGTSRRGNTAPFELAAPNFQVFMKLWQIWQVHLFHCRETCGNGSESVSHTSQNVIALIYYPASFVESGIYFSSFLRLKLSEKPISMHHPAINEPHPPQISHDMERERRSDPPASRF